MHQTISRLALLLITLCFTSLSFSSLPNHTTYNPSSNNNDQPLLSGAPASLAPFTQLIVTGNTDIVLKNGSWPSLQILNANVYNQVITLNNQAGALTINSWSSKKIPSQKTLPAVRPLIQITVPQLYVLKTRNDATVGGRITSTALNIETEDYSQVELTGMMNVQNITSTDHSRVKLYWVNSSNLVIAGSDKSIIKLAGVATVMHAYLNDQAQLNGQYLRAQQAIVRTDNQAFVGISATQALRGFASDDSNIFYYKYPQTLNDFSIESGNILQVDWRP